MNKELSTQIKKALETYNKYAEVYSNYLETKLLQFQLNAFMSRLTKGGKILDVGCANGRDVKYLQEDGFDVLGIDISKKLLAKAKGLNVKHMDILKPELEKQSFDGIWCMATLNDLSKKDAPKAVKSMYDLLKKQGIIYIAVKEGEGEKIIEKEKYNNAPRFYAYYSQQELENLLTAKGFTILKSEVSKDQKNKWIEIFAKRE